MSKIPSPKGVELLLYQVSLKQILKKFVFDLYTKIWIRRFNLQFLCFNFLLNYDLFCPNWSYSGVTQLMESCDYTSSPIFIILLLHDPASKTWL